MDVVERKGLGGGRVSVAENPGQNRLLGSASAQFQIERFEICKMKSEKKSVGKNGSINGPWTCHVKGTAPSQAQ